MEEQDEYEEFYVGSNPTQQSQYQPKKEFGVNEISFDDIVFGDTINHMEVSSVDDRALEDLHPKHIDVSHHFKTGQVFPSRVALMNWCKEVGLQLKIVVITFKSEKATAVRKGRLSMCCERSGTYRNHHKRLCPPAKLNPDPPNTGTRKCNCPFLLKGIPLDGDLWKLEVVSGINNHDLSKSLVGHAYVARLKDKEKKILIDMSLSGVRPREVLRTIKRTYGDNLSTMKTIYNAKAKMNLFNMEGRTGIQQLMKHLEDKHYVYWHRSNPNTDELLDLFWAHPQSVLLAKCFPSVIMLDCTYKTNRYKMPLLHIVGITSTEKTFAVAFVFLHSEGEESYTWAIGRLRTLFDPMALPNVFVTDREFALINAIRKVFDNPRMLLCTFHISKNVEHHCRDSFVSMPAWEQFLQQWTNVCKALSEDEFFDLWMQFKERWAAFPKDVAYLERTWLPHKENFVWAWTNSIKHLGNRTTNRAEGAHGVLKRYIESSQSTFDTVWTCMDNMCSIHFNEINALFEKSLSTTMHLHNLQEFRDLRLHVSHYALDMLFEENKKVQGIGISSSVCDHLFRNVFGLPCACELVMFQREGRPIPLSVIDPHWKKLSGIPNLPEYDDLDYEPEMKLFKKKWITSTIDEKQAMLRKLKEICMPTTTSMREPKVVVGKGRPRGKRKSKSNKDECSTKRDPSGFEYARAKASQDSMSDLRSIPIRKKANVSPVVSSAYKVPHPCNDKMKYLYFLPTVLAPYIEDIQDVQADGNCGYRAIALLKGWHEERSWKKVRLDLLKEMDKNKANYLRMFGDEFYKEFTIILNCFESPCSREFWMTMPEMGYLIASAYNVVLVFISTDQCLTFLPMWDSPYPGIPHSIISIGLINRSHFVQVYLKRGAPIPSIASMWYKHSSNNAKVWENKYHDKIRSFQEIIPKNIAVSDVIM